MMATSSIIDLNSNYCEQCQQLICFVGCEINCNLRGERRVPSVFNLILQQCASCSLCAQIFDQLSEVDLRRLPGILQNKDHVEDFTCPLTINSCIRVKLKNSGLERMTWPVTPIELGFWSKNDEILPIDITVLCLGRDDSSEQDIKDGNGHNIENSISSNETWELVKRWMTDCRLSHGCDKPRVRDGSVATPNTGLLPTRLVHIELLGSQLKARLVESKDLEDPIEYCTLSHCWGIVPFLTLRRHNYRTFKRDIRISRLSKTFQDSLMAANRLGFRYVWIDSLCIIQKDPDDWGREASMMSSVYAGSSLNLAATASYDGSGGLFFNRRLSTVHPCYVKLSSLGSNYFSCNPGGYDSAVFIKPPTRQKEIDNSPLAQRGWVLQERFLAPRTLHFGAYQIFWECKRGIVCETIPREQAFLSNTPMWFGHTLNGEDLFSAVPQATWGNIVRAYSKTLLTREQDKLVALAGIAQHFYVLMNDEYLAGLWRKGLEGQLLWSVKRRKACCEDNTPAPTRPSHYRAPTWSWASVDGHICPGSWNTLPCENMSIRVLDTKIDPVVPGCNFGQISSASLLLECGQLKQCKLSGRDIWAYSNGSQNLPLSTPTMPVGPMSTCASEKRYLSGNELDDIEYCMDVEPLENCLDVFLLLVEFSRNDRVDECTQPSEHFLKGLLLVPTGRRGEYQRFGNFRVPCPNFVNPETPFENHIIKVFLDLPGLEDYDGYVAVGENRSGKMRYQISLV